jgi:hypothetical protein
VSGFAPCRSVVNHPASSLHEHLSISAHSIRLLRVALLRARIEVLLLRDFPCVLPRELVLLVLLRALLERAPLDFLRADEPRDLPRDDNLLFVEVVGINVNFSVPKYFQHFGPHPKTARPCKFFRGRPDLVG